MSGFTIERIYPHPRERVWRALTDADILAQWLMPNDFKPELGHAFTFTTEPGPGFDGIVHCVVTHLDEPNALAFSWKGGPIDTVVRFELHDDERGTRLVMTQTGFKGLKAWLVGNILKIGSRSIYGKHLPAALDELAGLKRTAEHGPACMKPGQNIFIRLLALLERKKS